MHSDLQRLLREAPIHVTGCGSISAAGRGRADLWAAALAGQGLAQLHEGISRCPLPPGILEGGVVPRQARRMELGSQMALVAALDALADAGLEPGGWKADALGVIAGTSRGPVRKWIEAEERYTSGRRMLPSLAAHSTVSCLSGVIAQEIGARGPSMTVSATCASAAHAMVAAAEQILLGKSEIVLAGAADRGTDPLVVGQMKAARVLGSHPEDPGLACRPFDRERNGMVLGDGAGFLVLESAASVEHRGARSLGRLVGWATGTGHAGRSAVEPDGAVLARVLAEALALAGATPEEVAHVNAHGTGTPMNDAAELEAYRTVFGKAAAGCAFNSTKPVTGHCLGATGALEALLVLEALRLGQVPPVVGLANPDAKAEGLGLVQGAPREISGRLGMSNSSGFWSQHASLVFMGEGSR